ncbi:hypothetical protein F2Q70_00041917 [Brassica cretica]|uniref:NF-X1-type domain-containing protein n=1 Tax=Brassica cretica TaxID=69181 RepID=A0A8S9K9Z8_BRACR|nr:hypothetical protein F2Q70_00041917 [Brassica cretica]
MRNKGQKQNKFLRIISAPLRALGKARDFYMRSITGCSARTHYSSAASVSTPFPRSRSSSSAAFSSSASTRRTTDFGIDDDYSELVRAASVRSLGHKNEIDMFLHEKLQQEKLRQRGLPKSSSVGMAKIEEEDEAEEGSLTSSREISYRCLCGKRKDPTSDPYLIPHSCGEPCGKPLEKDFAAKEDLCPHVCVLQCHPGPCPPCKAFAPPRSCPCGKKMIHTRCSGRRSPHVCGQRCEKLLSCGRHRCERSCHVGTCEPCQGLGCGNHLCSEVCHAGPCGDCDLLPSRVKTCYCGKKRLEEEIRESCLEQVPSCSNICLKLLPCGLHTCTEACHGGDCPPCLVQVNQKCRSRFGHTRLPATLWEEAKVLAAFITSIPPPLPCGTPVPTCQLPCSIPQPCHFGDWPGGKKCVGGHVV